MKINREQVAKIRNIIICIILAVFIFTVIYRPMAAGLRDAERDLQALEAQLLAQRGSITVLKGLELPGPLMPQKEAASVINEVTEKGGELGVEFVSITPGTLRQTEQPSVMVLPVSFKIESEYKALGEFLVYLEEFPRTLTEIKDPVIRPQEKIASRLNSEFRVNFYMEANNEEK